jgi:glycosyltransferase involved in cell wall biosynthesis
MGEKMKKKLLIFLPSLAGGGAERTVVNIINYIDKKIFDVTLVLISKNINNEHKHEYLENLNSNVKVLYLNCKLSRLHIFNIIYKLCQTINKENPDIIFSTTFNANVISIISNKLAKKNIPVVIRETTNRTKLGVNLFGKLVTRFIYNQSDTVVSLSKGVKNDLINNFKVKKEKIKLIYNPVDIKHINNSKNAKVEDFLLPKENMKNIIAVGRLIEAKDFSVLLKAFKLISNNIKSRLLILGKGPEENKLKL